MMHYHGCPITPNTSALRALLAGHACLSFPNRGQMDIVVEATQSWIADNGAFPAWRSGNPIYDWDPFYKWAYGCVRIPNCDFVIIPDEIDGTEEDNDRLLEDCPIPKSMAAPVWHLHESLERLERLIQTYPRICLGSSGGFAKLKTREWWDRMAQAWTVICDDLGRPRCKVHGLRMLDPDVFTVFPFSSADSTNIGRNIGIDVHWSGSYSPVGSAMKDWRALTLRNRIEAFNSPTTWGGETPKVRVKRQGIWDDHD